uniref:Uncharacterized protein n=1 Tax=Aegilops tauschii subsp. strangulata TaxID=200361 RepID=A0A453HE29_AEGTS
MRKASTLSAYPNFQVSLRIDAYSSAPQWSMISSAQQQTR